MKKLLALLTVVSLTASCSRSGTTIANDDSAINSQITNPANSDRRMSDYPITEKELTDEVRNAFYSRFPDAQNKQWLWLRDGNFRCDFFLGKTKWTVIYAPDGTLLFEYHA